MRAKDGITLNVLTSPDTVRALLRETSEVRHGAV